MRARTITLVCLLCMGSLPVMIWAQLPNDAIYMPKNTICIAGVYSRSSWSAYWENDLKRKNENIGTNTTESAMLMAAWGLGKNLNLIAGLPYIWTHNSAGNLKGQQNIQDLMVTLKYKFLDRNRFTINGGLGFTTPMSNYVAEFLPMSIGTQSNTGTARLIVNYHHPRGWYVTAQAGYTARAETEIDRNSYLAYDRMIYSSKVSVPDIVDGGLQLGYLKNAFQAALLLERFDCVKGDYIRRNDMPFLTNDMNGNSIGAYIKYQPGHLGFNLRYGYILNGRNIGQSNMISGGILYQFAYYAKEKMLTE
jgi:hypothetical protein